MKINWRVRLKNKIWLLTFLLAIIAFMYQILGMAGVATPISEDQATQVIGMMVNILVTIGVVVDPTTAGPGDSDRAMTYDKPR